MAQTRGALVAEALLMVGNPTLTARANAGLNRQLRKAYTSWPWPFLQKRAGKEIPALPLGQGVQSVQFGLGQGGEPLEVQRLIDPIFMYTPDFATQARPRIVVQPNPELIVDESIQNPATFIGQPQQFKVRPNGLWGQWLVIPTPFPDKAYLLAIDYLVCPADITSDSTTPIYPNDQTMIQMVIAEIEKYNAAGSGDLSRYQAAVGELNEMLVNDRMRFGYATGINDQVGLDPARFSAQVTPIVK